MMKKFYTKLLPLFFMILIMAYGCGKKQSENAEVDKERMESGTQKASPVHSAQGKIGTTDVKIQYGSPAVRNRVIWGDLLPYGEVWRTGANEATFVDFSQDVTVEGKPLKAGKYSLFTILRSKATGQLFLIRNGISNTAITSTKKKTMCCAWKQLLNGKIPPKKICRSLLKITDSWCDGKN